MEQSAWSTDKRTLVGNRLHRIRIQQQLSVRKVSEMAGVSKTTVVQVEAGRTNRLRSYEKIAAAYGLHIDRLQEPSDDSKPYAIHRRDEDLWYDLTSFDDGPLSPDAQTSSSARSLLEGITPLNILKSRLENGRIKPTILELTGESPTRCHVGEEFVYVLEGSAIVSVGNHVVTLHEGESLTFWSAEAHSYRPAPDSQLPARILSVRVDG